MTALTREESLATALSLKAGDRATVTFEHRDVHSVVTAAVSNYDGHGITIPAGAYYDAPEESLRVVCTNDWCGEGGTFPRLAEGVVSVERAEA